MTTLVKSTVDVYDEFMASGDPCVTTWMFMSSPIPVLSLVASYVLFVKKIGPALMTDKKPFELRYPMFLYNFLLVLTNLYFLFDTLRILFKPNQSWTCSRDIDKTNPDVFRIKELGWWFFFLKLVEFADTVFFVLRKKYKQISTLHVVHHAIVPIAVWTALRIEPGSYNYFFPLINTIVHIIMYSYYGLAALGPSVQRYLWWKKYLTTLQMIQFVMVFFFILFLMTATDCKLSKFFVYLNSFLAGLFLIMFSNYFRKTYLVNKDIQKHKHMDSDKAEKRKKIAGDLQNGKRTPVEKKVD